MKLRPALRIHGRVLTGDKSDSHITLATRKGVEAPEHVRGFSPDGRMFLDRKQALEWIRKHEPATYTRLKDVPPEGLHSQIYAKANGIIQREVKPLDKIDLSKKKAIVYDRGGLYLYCAEKLAESYECVYYYLADADAYPCSNKAKIGTGLAVDRIENFWKHLDEVDIIYFFDCYDGELQHWLRSKGYTVFGSGRSDIIEIDKVGFIEKLKELGLPCAETFIAEGIEDLEEILEDNDGEVMYLKNLKRGDFESRKFKSMAQIKPFLDDLEKRLGPAAEDVKVIVQKHVESACESGYDGFCIDGQFTKNCIVGYEVKDKGFIGKVFSEPPEVIKSVNDAFSDTFKKLGYRGGYSTEIRITEDGTPYFIDPTCRIGSPPGELMVELYDNWAEATWHIAKGIVPELKPCCKYGAVIILTSEWHCDHALHVSFPKQIAEYVKLKNHCREDGEYYCIPNGNGAFFGAVIGMGDTASEAVKQALKHLSMIEADELDVDDGLFDDADKAMKAGRKFNIDL